MSGSLGVGKTSIGESLSAKIPNSHFKPEKFMTNRYLPLFYKEMSKNGPFVYNNWAYASQMLFLKDRIHREQDCNDPNLIYILDRSVYEDRHIFAQLMRENGLMSKEEFRDYKIIFEKIVRNLDPPNTVVYIRAEPETILERMKDLGDIKSRGINRGYLRRLNELYETRYLERIKLINPDCKIFDYTLEDYLKDEDLLRDQIVNDLIGQNSGDKKKVSTKA